jgi:L-malate glycosyltransferase
MKRPLTIFVPHCSDLLTDHMPHGDGLIAHGFISRLARRGHRIHVAVQKVDLQEPLGSNVTIHPMPGESRGRIVWRLAYMHRLRRLFWKLRLRIPFDLIHQLNPVFTGLSLSLAGSGVPLVLGTYVARWPSEQSSTVAGGCAERAVAYVRDMVSALQQRHADTLVLTTPAARNRLPNAGCVGDRVRFLPHGIDTKLFSPAPASESMAQCTGDRNQPSILFFSNVVKRKGIFTLIDAFATVATEVPNVQLRIAGDGPDLAEAKQRVARSSCAHQVKFLGSQKLRDAPAFYRSCSVYCLPSFGEPYGGSLVEAMSCGKPVVVTDSGGPPHIVSTDGGCLVPAGDRSALARALIELLRDPARRASMGRHNRHVVETTMSWDHVVEQLEDIYATTLSRDERRENRHNDSVQVSPGVDRMMETSC